MCTEWPRPTAQPTRQVTIIFHGHCGVHKTHAPRPPLVTQVRRAQWRPLHVAEGPAGFSLVLTTF